MKDFFIGVSVAAFGGLLAYLLIQKFSPKSNQTPADVIRVLSPAAPWSENPSSAPAGYFWDPNTGRLVQQAAPNAGTFDGSGGTVQSEAWPPGTAFA